MTTDIQSMFDAASNEDTEAIKDMLANGADINAADHNGTTALHLAAINDEVAVAQTLLECGADPNVRTPDGRTALYLAVELNHFFTDLGQPCSNRARAALIRVLLEHGADTNAEADDGTAPLGLAVAAHNDENVRLLLEHGADVQRYSGKKNAEKLLARLTKEPRPWSIKEDPWDSSSPAGDRIFQLLLDYGWEFDAKLMTNCLYLSEAVRNDLRHMAAFLLMHGEDANEPAGYEHNDEFSPFLLAELVESNEGETVVDKSHTVLHAAAALRQPDIAALLLEHGANPNTANAKRETPLHISVRSANWPITKLLLQHGANPHAKDKSGKSPLDLEEDKDLQALMLKHASASSCANAGVTPHSAD
ncbi:MAG: ankyrin repeat domain-containing protein [Akkermansia sp.]|nr:ankyrin repeat domain-containing protein [Akkermansia sp.]